MKSYIFIAFILFVAVVVVMFFVCLFFEGGNVGIFSDALCCHNKISLNFVFNYLCLTPHLVLIFTLNFSQYRRAYTVWSRFLCLMAKQPRWGI